MSRLLAVLTCLLAAQSLGGCSVAMALQGKEATDLTAIETGSTRDQIEERLGPPAGETVDEHGSTVVSYRFYEQQSPAPMRAVAHALLDFLTFGIWEAVGTPMETAVDADDTRTLTVTYAQDGQALAINRPARREDDLDLEPEVFAAVDYELVGPPGP